MTTAAAMEFPRQFLAPTARFDAWESARPYYEELVARSLNTRAEFERWLFDWSELDSAFDEELSDRYIEMTRQTDDPAREQRYLDFIEHVKPHREPLHHQLRRKLIETAQRLGVAEDAAATAQQLPRLRYEVLLRSARGAVALYRDENVPLLVEDDKLRQEYQRINAAMMVVLDGRECTLPQAALRLEETDRAQREAAWRAIFARVAQDQPALDAIYEKMVALRTTIARNAGCPDYRAYMFKALERFDYSPDDCLRFHDAIEEIVVPAVRRLAEQRRARLDLTTLRPWDFAVDPHGHKPLRPFQTDDELIRGSARIFHAVNPEFGAIFDTMRERGALDLGSRKGKAPGGYQQVYPERRLPFIFMNAVGSDTDVRVLLHEGGHAFHSWLCRQDPLYAYRNYPTEFAEVASMGMECLALPFTREFYGVDDARAHRQFFEKIVTFFPFMACIDAFQHYVYTHVDAGIEGWNEEWVRLVQRFSPEVDYSGLEAVRRRSWQRKLHIFEVPFYYVEYGIAQLGALQVWQNSRRDFQEAVDLYRRGLSLGGARPLPELFAAAGCRFDFSAATLRPLIDAVMEEIEKE